MRTRFTAAALAAGFALFTSPAPASAEAPEIESVQSALAETREELAATRAELAAANQALAELTRRVDALQDGAASPSVAQGGTARIAPVNADNPAMSFVVDTTFSSDTEGTGSGFSLRSGELFVSAPIDPFLRGYASINGSSEEGFNIEEAALITTSLPWNLSVKGGRFFADVGRFSSWHDETLPFVDRPPSLDRIIGGESGAEGVEVSWLAPTDLFLQLTGGVYNSIGNERREELMEQGFDGRRGYGELTYLVHPLSYFDLTETWSLELGGTFAFVPKDHARSLYGADVTLRHQPGTRGFYQGLVVGAEWLWNDELFDESDPTAVGPALGSQRLRRNGGYVYGEAFFGRRYSAGLRYDDAQEIFGDADRQRTYSAFATWKPSEFHRLRLQLDHVDGADYDNQRFTVQWTAFLGSHTHGFRVR